MSAAREVRIPIMMSRAEVDAIDTWRFANKVATRADAVRRLCATALAQRAASAEARVAELEAALEPFAIVGLLIDRFLRDRPDGGLFTSGCAWTEGGEKKTLTWGDLRRARAALRPDTGDGT